MNLRQFATASLVVATFGVTATHSLASTIAAVEAQSSGTAATLDNNPVVTAILSQPGTVNGLNYTTWTLLVNDGTGSLDVFGQMPASNPSYVPAVGDAISASGTYSPFHQIPEVASLTAISRVSTGNPIPAVSASTIPTLNVSPAPFTNVEYLWSLNNVKISAGTNAVPATWGTSNLSLTVTDTASNSLTLFYWPTSYSLVNANLFGQTVSTGLVDMTGFVSVFGTGPTAVVEYTPISITAVPAPEPASIVLVAIGVVGIALVRGPKRLRRWLARG